MQGERGFTLVEVLVVTAVVGILASLALAGLLSQRSKAQDADAKSAVANLRLKIEICAVQAPNSYADCATPTQLESGNAPVAKRDGLPPFGQFAAAGGPSAGAANPSAGIVLPGHNGIKNGAECVHSNGKRTCRQTSAGDVGDCVESDVAEVGCIGIIATTSSYLLTVVSKTRHVFTIVNLNGVLTRSCAPAGSAGCPDSGTWN